MRIPTLCVGICSLAGAIEHRSSEPRVGGSQPDCLTAVRLAGNPSGCTRNEVPFLPSAATGFSIAKTAHACPNGMASPRAETERIDFGVQAQTVFCEWLPFWGAAAVRISLRAELCVATVPQIPQTPHEDSLSSAFFLHPFLPSPFFTPWKWTIVGTRQDQFDRTRSNSLGFVSSVLLYPSLR